MLKVYNTIEKGFEKLVALATRVYGNSLTFILAMFLVLLYLISPKFYNQDLHDCIKDIILCVTFISFFIIQKSVNKFSIALHLKMNELVAAHENASNRMINVESKSEGELQELSQQYSNLVDKINESSDEKKSHSIDHILPENENNALL